MCSKLLALLALCTIACNTKALKDPTSADANGNGIPDEEEGLGGGGGAGGASGSVANYGIGGSVSGLKRLGLVLAQGADMLEIQGNGDFRFPTRLRDGADYAVKIQAQPLKQVCTLAQGTGTIAAADALAVSVTCVDASSIGGTIYGLNSGATLTLANNGGDPLTLAANGAFTFRTALLSGDAYAVTIAAMTGATVECTVLNGTGTLSGADKNDVAVHCLSAAQPVLAAASDWNSYFRYVRNAQNVLVPQACTGLEAGHYGRCMHGGEQRQIDVPGLSSCITTAADELLAFEWECSVTASGVVRYSSKGLKAGKGLADLIDFDTATFRSNRLVINAGGTFIRTPLSKWWANPVIVGAVDTAFSSGTIYAYKTNPGRTFVVPSAAARVGIVLQSGVIATGTAAANETLVSVADTPFVWVEGTFDASGDDDGVALSGSRYPVLHQVRVLGAAKRGVVLVNTKSAMVRDVQVASTGEEGLSLDTASFATVRRASVSHAGTAAGKSGVLVKASNNPIVEQLIVSNQIAAAGAGVLLDTVVGGVLTQLTIAQSQGSALKLVNAQENTFLAATLHDNAAAGVAISGTSKNNRLFNVALSRSGGTAFSDTSSVPSTTQLNVVTITGAQSSPFVGTSGSAAAVSNWFGPFEHPLQAWGQTNAAACTGASCLKKDFGVLLADTLVKGTTAVPAITDTFKHRFVPTVTTQSGCTDQFPGSTYVTVDSQCEALALRSAIELANDGNGTDNALCEAFDNCVFTPNAASDLGFGALVSQTLGTASSATDRVSPSALVAYQSNGR